MNSWSFRGRPRTQPKEDPTIRISPDHLDPLPAGLVPALLEPPLAGSRPLGVVTTGRLEERVIQRFGQHPAAVEISAGSEDGTAAALDQLIKRGVSGLVSFGVAAALAPAAQPGRLVLADAVALPDGSSRATDAGWRRALADRLQPLGLEPLQARIAGGASVPGHAADRTTLFQHSIAAALDTESHLVAEAAHAHGLPFVVLRVVVDEVQRPSLGTAVLTMTAAGRWRRGVALGLLRPWQAAQVLRAARDLELGLQVLARALPALDAPPATSAH